MPVRPEMGGQTHLSSSVYTEIGCSKRLAENCALGENPRSRKDLVGGVTCLPSLVILVQSPVC
jgi:hypothetical protein